MITINHSPNRVDVAVLGEFTLADYQEFEELVNFKIQFEGAVDLLVDLREMTGFTLDVAWEDLRFTKSHAKDFRYIAIVSDSQWVKWSAWLSLVSLGAEVATFNQPEEALAWINS